MKKIKHKTPPRPVQSRPIKAREIQQNESGRFDVSLSYFVENPNVRNLPYPVRIRWSRQQNLVPFYLYKRIFECPENIRNNEFPDVQWSSNFWELIFSELLFSAKSKPRGYLEHVDRLTCVN